MSQENNQAPNLFLANATLWVSAFISPFLYLGMNNILPTIAIEMSASASSISFVVILFGFAQSLFGAISGKLGDLFGMKKMLNLGYIFTILTLFGLYIAEDFIIITIYRFLQGVGTAFIVTCSTAIAVKINPINKRGAIMGFMMGSAYLGMSLAPVIAGTMSTFLGWRIFFLSLFFFCIATVFLANITVKVSSEPHEAEKFDLIGCVLFALGLGFISLAAGLFSLYPIIVILLPAGIVFLYLFVKWENKVASPIINFANFRRLKNLRLGLLATLANFASTASVVYFLSIYFQQVRGYTPLVAGAFFLCNSVPQFITTPITGALSDKIHPEFIVIIGLVLTGCSLLAMSLIEVDTSLIYIGLALFMTGISVALFAAPCAVSLLRGVDYGEIGATTGLIGTFRISGVLFGQAMISFMTSYYLGNEVVTPQNADLFLSTMRSSLYVFIIFNIIFITLYFLYSKEIIKEDKLEKEIME